MDFAPTDDPLDVLDRWREEAGAAGVVLPESMTLATVGLDGLPAARVVLLKGREGKQLFFFTNYESRKSRELERNPHVSLVFHYATAQRQVRVDGRVEKLSAAQSDAYFQTRPRESQIGAWASRQSEVLEGRATLESAIAEVGKRFEGVSVPRPDFWGGYAVTAQRVELWSGRVGRLHERGLYVAEENSGWSFQWLWP